MVKVTGKGIETFELRRLKDTTAPERAAAFERLSAEMQERLRSSANANPSITYSAKTGAGEACQFRLSDMFLEAGGAANVARPADPPMSAPHRK